MGVCCRSALPRRGASRDGARCGGFRALRSAPTVDAGGAREMQPRRWRVVHLRALRWTGRKKTAWRPAANCSALCTSCGCLRPRARPSAVGWRDCVPWATEGPPRRERRAGMHYPSRHDPRPTAQDALPRLRHGAHRSEIVERRAALAGMARRFPDLREQKPATLRWELFASHSTRRPTVWPDVGEMSRSTRDIRQLPAAGASFLGQSKTYKGSARCADSSALL
eukprot:scaffold1809_cov386-Prasinococcus_capsulatus_cf.AAC.24